MRLSWKSRTAPPPPDGLVDGLPHGGVSLYPERERKRSIFLSLPMKIAGGIACSLIGTVIINATSLKVPVLAAVSTCGIACSAINSAMGDPLGGLKDKLGIGDKPLPNIVIHGKSPEQIEAERKTERAELVAEAEALGLSWREDWPNAKLKVEVREGQKRKEAAEKAEREAQRERKHREAEEEAAREKERAEEEAREIQRAAEAEERAELVARATAVGFGVNDTLPLREMRRQVQAAEKKAAANGRYQLRHRQWEKAMARWQDQVDNGRNAACPACRTPCHVSPTASPGKIVMCNACKYTTSRSVFRAQFTPPPPPVEPMPPTLEAFEDDGEGKPSGGGILSGLTGGFQ